MATKIKDNQRLFKTIANQFLESNPQLKYEWKSDDKDEYLILTIFRQDDKGFDVSIWVDENEITLATVEGQHSHYSFEEIPNPEQHVRNIFGLVRDLLSNKMRIIMKLAGGIAYKISLQSWNGKAWSNEDTFGHIFFNYFGKRSEQILQNNILEGKLIDERKP